MAITTTEILGTDSISASRIVINDNFSILRDEINAIESYIDPDAGTIDGLNSLISTELRIGTTGSYKLEVTSTEFNINDNVNFTGNISVNGIISNSSFGILDEAAFTGTVTVDPTSGFSSYSIKHASTSSFAILLDDGNIGQEVTLYCEQKGGGQVLVQASGTSTLVLDSTNNKIDFTDVGSSVTLKFVLDSTNNGFWIVKSYSNVTYIN